jgi:hypothetical protein
METPEVELFRKILAQAVRDALSRNKSETREKNEAISFLTDTFGYWRENLEFICDFANKCPERVRKGTLRAISEGKGYKELMRELALL